MLTTMAAKIILPHKFLGAVGIAGDKEHQQSGFSITISIFCYEINSY